MIKHTKEPWVAIEHDQKIGKQLAGRWRITAEARNAEVRAEFPDFPYNNLIAVLPALSEANANHIVSCVNNCAGINPEAILDMVREFIGIRDGIHQLAVEIYSMTIPLRTAAEVESSLKRLERISDAALKKAGVVE